MRIWTYYIVLPLLLCSLPGSGWPLLSSTSFLLNFVEVKTQPRRRLPRPRPESLGWVWEKGYRRFTCGGDVLYTVGCRTAMFLRKGLTQHERQSLQAGPAASSLLMLLRLQRTVTKRGSRLIGRNDSKMRGRRRFSFSASFLKCTQQLTYDTDKGWTIMFIKGELMLLFFFLCWYTTCSVNS